MVVLCYNGKIPHDTYNSRPKKRGLLREFDCTVKKIDFCFRTFFALIDYCQIYGLPLTSHVILVDVNGMSMAPHKPDSNRSVPHGFFEPLYDK